MKRCPKCNGINDDKAKYCHFCGNKLYQNLTIKCPKCGRLCSLDRKHCPNCGTKLPIINKKLSLTFYPKSWLENKKLLIRLGIILIAIISTFCLVASLKSTTYLYHASTSRKVQINYQNSDHETIFSEYYDIRPLNRNYANYFGGKESLWHKNRSFREEAYYYGKNQNGYNRLWKENNGKPLTRYIMIQRIKKNENLIEIKKEKPKVTIQLISSQKDPVKFIDQYRDQGQCYFPNNPQIRYYQLNTLSQY